MRPFVKNLRLPYSRAMRAHPSHVCQTEALRRHNRTRARQVRLGLLMSSNDGLTRMAALKLLGPSCSSDSHWRCPGEHTGELDHSCGSDSDEDGASAGATNAGNTAYGEAEVVAENSSLRNQRGIQFVPMDEAGPDARSGAQRLVLGTDSIFLLILSFADGLNDFELGHMEQHENKSLVEVRHCPATPKPTEPNRSHPKHTISFFGR